jgi:CRISPR system Cascade subunit CasC
MTQPTGDFLQIHALTSYPAVLLNRDDVGLAKRLPFGDAVRIRVSSQCLKKHWRDAIAAMQDRIPPAVRSRRIFDHFVADALAREGVAESAANRIAQALSVAVLQQKRGAASESEANEEQSEAGEVEQGQVLVLSQAEVDFLGRLAQELVVEMKEAQLDTGDGKKLEKWLNGKGLKESLKKHPQLRALPASFDTAMFGRFITSDVLSRVDAAVSVAHAFTTHAEQAETDYFTAIDMLTDEPGAGLLSDTELTTGVFYVYVVIDLNKLRENLMGQEDLAPDLTRWLVEAIATVSPGAKRGSTAPYAYAEFILLERGSAQPRTLANAFRRALPVTGEEGADLMSASIRRMLIYRQDLETMYGELARPSRVVGATIRREAAEGIDLAPLPQALEHALA